MKSSSSALEPSGPAVGRPTVDARGALRRTLTFVAALLTLLVFARSGQGALTVWVVFAVFVAAATVWLRGQYADSLDGKQWVIPFWVGSAMAGVAVPVLAVSLVAVHRGWHPRGVDFGLLGIGAVILIYLVIGSAITQIRQTCSIRVRGRILSLRPWGLLLTVAGLVLGVGGGAVLGWGNWITGVVLLILGVAVLVPAGMALGSEQAIRWICRRREATPWLWGLGAGGAVLFTGMTTAAVAVSKSDWLTPVMVVFGLFVVAMVSTTHADVVAVMAGIALMGITPPQVPENLMPHPTDKNTKVLVALGDSYMSGEGASIFYGGGDRRDKRWCNRAPTAWAVLIAQDDHRFDGLKFLACAGAREQQVREQVDDYVADAARDHYAKPAMVVLSLGGNDAGFAKIAETCLAPYDCDEIKKNWLGMVDQMPKVLDAVYQKVDDAFRGVPVVVVPYPLPIKPDVDGCPQMAFSRSERGFVEEFTTKLNRAIIDTAGRHGFYYVAQMQEALAKEHLQLCDPTNGRAPGINFIGLRSVHGHAGERFNPSNWTHISLHPNESGHIAMRRVFREWLDANYARTQASPRNFQASSWKATGPAPCGIEECKSLARAWEAHQVGKRLIKQWLWLFLAGTAAGAWMVAVAFFAYRRRAHAPRG
ncbi:GDSL-type esterase/lipase family protein [Actinoplanes sp. HUAS TT8]|uniref:GDSL-type esterase/lipase family protein n=1 Tax=Actinoplanes sp. HUAS TT8 TaxID=3447453 RepID=UPI003F5288E1